MFSYSSKEKLATLLETIIENEEKVQFFIKRSNKSKKY